MKIYPLVSDYKLAVDTAESFATKTSLVPHREDGQLYFAVGGPAVVFKMRDTDSGLYYALKCFVKHQENRDRNFEAISRYLNELDDNPYFVSYEYLQDELWAKDADFPVLLMPWIEGKTLSKYIGELCFEGDDYTLRDIANKFDKMALWLLESDMAHGDLKPDNIIVTDSGDLMLVDYDGMFVPELAGTTSPELGTAEYRHPKRSKGDFNAQLDDFPILVLSLSLHSLATDPSLYNAAKGGDALLLRSEDYENLLSAENFSFFQSKGKDSIISPRFSMLMYSITQPIIKLEGLRELLKITAADVEPLAIKRGGVGADERSYREYEYRIVLFDDYNDRFYKVSGVGWIDEFGGVLNSDKTTFMQANDRELKNYIIPNSVTSIKECAFWGCGNLTSITIPDSVTSIGMWAFNSCKKLTSITISDSVTWIDKRAFDDCTSLTSITIANSEIFIEESAFWGCGNLTSIYIPRNSQGLERDLSDYKEKIKYID